MTGDNEKTRTGKEARFLIVKLNNLAERLEREGGLMVADYTKGLMRNPAGAHVGQVKALRDLSGRVCVTDEARRLAEEIRHNADRLLTMNGWEAEDRLTPEGASERKCPSSAPRARQRRRALAGLFGQRAGTMTAAGRLAAMCR